MRDWEKLRNELGEMRDLNEYGGVPYLKMDLVHNNRGRSVQIEGIYWIGPSALYWLTVVKELEISIMAINTLKGHDPETVSGPLLRITVTRRRSQ